VGILSEVAGILGFVHSTGFVVGRDLAILLAVVFWLSLAFWVHRDARRRISDDFLVLVAGVVGLVPPYLGPLVYLLFRPSETLAEVRCRQLEVRALELQLGRAQQACPFCSSPVEDDYLTCPVCTTMLREPCATCKAPLEILWQMCPYCATPIELSPSQADLDAALTAELKTISAWPTAQTKGARSPAPLPLSRFDRG